MRYHFTSTTALVRLGGCEAEMSKRAKSPGEYIIWGVVLVQTVVASPLVALERLLDLVTVLVALREVSEMVRRYHI